MIEARMSEKHLYNYVKEINNFDLQAGVKTIFKIKIKYTLPEAEELLNNSNREKTRKKDKIMNGGSLFEFKKSWKCLLSYQVMIPLFRLTAEENPAYVIPVCINDWIKDFLYPSVNCNKNK